MTHLAQQRAHGFPLLRCPAVVEEVEHPGIVAREPVCETGTAGNRAANKAHCRHTKTRCMPAAHPVRSPCRQVGLKLTEVEPRRVVLLRMERRRLRVGAPPTQALGGRACNPAAPLALLGAAQATPPPPERPPQPRTIPKKSPVSSSPAGGAHPSSSSPSSPSVIAQSEPAAAGPVDGGAAGGAWRWVCVAACVCGGRG